MSDVLHGAFAPRADRVVCDRIKLAVSKLHESAFVVAQAVDIIQSADKECRRIPVDAVVRLLLTTQRDIAEAAGGLDRLQQGTQLLPYPLSWVELAG